MTALKPLENLLVRGVPSTKYPVNDACSHPECAEPRLERKGAHHIFPRSLITNDSYFVQIHEIKDVEQGRTHNHTIIPHVTWLCPQHHDDVEMHRAWIKLEEGDFVWYDQDPERESWLEPNHWIQVGPLDPQPGGRVKAGNPKKKRKTGDEKRKTKTKTFRFPDDVEDGRGQVEDNLEELERILGYDPPRSEGWRLMDATAFALMWVRDHGEVYGFPKIGETVAELFALLVVVPTYGVACFLYGVYLGRKDRG